MEFNRIFFKTKCLIGKFQIPEKSVVKIYSKYFDFHLLSMVIKSDLPNFSRFERWIMVTLGFKKYCCRFNNKFQKFPFIRMKIPFIKCLRSSNFRRNTFGNQIIQDFTNLWWAISFQIFWNLWLSLGNLIESMYSIFANYIDDTATIE